VPPERAQQLCALLCQPLARRLQVSEPDPEVQRVFLEDLLAAEFRRQQRKLG
jgi:hypothetical protein